MNKKYKIYLTTDFAMSFISVFGVIMFLSMLPKLQSIFHVTVSEISWIPNLGYVTMILFAFLSGRFINGGKLKNLLILSLSMWIFGILIEYISLNTCVYIMFVFGRFVEGIGEAFISPILLSMNKIIFSSEKLQKLGSSFIELGGAVGGLASAFISGRFIERPDEFLLIPIIIGFLNIVFISISLDNVILRCDNEENKVQKSYKESNIVYVSLLMMILIIQMVFSSSQIYMAYYMKAAGRGNYTSLVLAGEQIFLCIGTVMPIFMLKKVSFKNIRNIILSVFIFSTIIVGFQISAFLSVLFFMIMTLFVGIGFTILNVYVSKVIKNKVSMKISIYTSVRNSGGLILSLTWGKIMQLYLESGKSYNIIFKNLYVSESLIILMSFIIIICLQKNQPKDLN